jgi:biopolymer transport protein ExbD
MPAMKIRSPIRRKKARLEIIPLIDIMFFLLASFMMVSLQMQKVRTLKASLPTATLAASAPSRTSSTSAWTGWDSFIWTRSRISRAGLLALLTNRFAHNTNLPVSISGDRDARYGETISVLDFVKQAGIQRVAVAVTGAEPPRASQKNEKFPTKPVDGARLRPLRPVRLAMAFSNRAAGWLADRTRKSARTPPSRATPTPWTR